MISLIPFFGFAILVFAWRNPVVVFSINGLLPVALYRIVALLAWATVLYTVIPLTVGPVDFTGIPLWRIPAAGLEDALFVLPAFFIPRPWRWAFLAFSSAVFCSGHAYQGGLYALAKLPFVFVTYFLAERYGMLTAIAAHSLNDIGCWLAFAALRGIK